MLESKNLEHKEIVLVPAPVFVLVLLHVARRHSMLKCLTFMFQDCETCIRLDPSFGKYLM